MPTGYTADVVSGKATDFDRFALTCARAFGALIMMRDESWDTAIPEQFEPSDYNQKRLEEAKEENLKLQKMSTEEVEQACEESYQKQASEREKYIAVQTLENERLEAMAEHVKRWIPRSANHAEMKKFMLDQWNISKHDWSHYKTPIKKLTASEWLRERLETVQREIGYHAAEHEKEVERTNARNLWVKQLRQSLSEKVV